MSLTLSAFPADGLDPEVGRDLCDSFFVDGAHYNVEKVPVESISLIEFWLLRNGDRQGTQDTALFYFQNDKEERTLGVYLDSSESRLYFEDPIHYSAVQDIPLSCDFAKAQHFAMYYAKDFITVVHNGVVLHTTAASVQWDLLPAQLRFNQLLSCKESFADPHSTYTIGLRIWQTATPFPVDDLWDLASTRYDLFPESVDYGSSVLVYTANCRGLFDVFYSTDRVVIPPGGESADLFPKSMLSDTLPQSVVPNIDRRNLLELNVIDFWVKPVENDEEGHHPQCVFEISDGLEVGNLFGMYLTDVYKKDIYDLFAGVVDPAELQPMGENLKLGTTIDLRVGRFSHGFNFMNLPILTPGRFHHICFFIVADLAEETVYLNIILNGYSLLIPNEIGPEWMDFELKYMALKESLEGKCPFKGELIGPRFWSSSYLKPDTRIGSIAEKVAAYAYTDLRNFNVFGAIEKQGDLFGRLAGILTPKISKTTGEMELRLLKRLSKDMTLLPEGIELDLPDDHKIYLKKYKQADCSAGIELGEIPYPNPMRQFVKGHPKGLFFHDVSMIDLWFKPNDTLTTGDLTLFDLYGLAKGEVEPMEYSFRVFYRSDDATLYAERTINGTVSTPAKVDAPLLNNGRFHHLCFLLNDEEKVNAITLRINGLAAVNVGQMWKQNFDFYLETVFVGSSHHGTDTMKGNMCGPRFWTGKKFDEARYHVIPFIHYFEDPAKLRFRSQRLLGRVDLPSIDKDFIEGYDRVKTLLVDSWNGEGPVFDFPELEDLKHYEASTETEKKGSGFTPVRKPTHYKSDRFVKFLGTWVAEKSDLQIPELSNIKDHNGKEIGREKHCFYKQPIYFNLVKDERTHQFVLIDPLGDEFTAFHSNDEFIPFKASDGSIAYRVEMITHIVRAVLADDANEHEHVIDGLYIRSILPGNASWSGLYKRPYRKAPWPDDDSGNIFLNRPPNFDTVLMGYDITRLDPAQYFDFEGTTGNPIFRLPPGKSSLFDLHQGIAIPFGWNYVPFVSYHADTNSTMMTTSSDIEKETTSSVMHKSSVDNKVSGSAGVPGVFAAKFSLELGFNSESNRETAQRTKNLEEKQTFSSYQNWYCTSHDIVLDKPNVLFTGQFIEGDDPEHFNFRNGFYFHVQQLKDKVVDGVDKIEDYLELLDRYGTHFLHSVRFGSKGWRIHEFSQETCDYLQQNNLKLSHVKGSKVGVGAGATGGIDGFSAGIEDQLNTEDSNGTSSSVSNSSELKNLMKNEKEESGSRGSYSESSVDHVGEIHVYRYLEPIYELLAPPFFNDLVINTQVRAALKKGFDRYMQNSHANWPTVDFSDDYYQVTIDIDIDFQIEPTRRDILNIPTLYSDEDFTDSSIDRYNFSSTLHIETGGQVRDIPLSVSSPATGQNFTSRQQIILNERMRVFKDGSIQTIDDNKELYLKLSGTLDVNMHENTLWRRGWFHKDKVMSHDIPSTHPVLKEDRITLDFTANNPFTQKFKFGTVTIKRDLISTTVVAGGH